MSSKLSDKRHHDYQFSRNTSLPFISYSLVSLARTDESCSQFSLLTVTKASEPSVSFGSFLVKHFSYELVKLMPLLWCPSKCFIFELVSICKLRLTVKHLSLLRQTLPISREFIEN
jgi:hypothetical protein